MPLFHTPTVAKVLMIVSLFLLFVQKNAKSLTPSQRNMGKIGIGAARCAKVPIFPIGFLMSIYKCSVAILRDVD